MRTLTRLITLTSTLIAIGQAAAAAPQSTISVVSGSQNELLGWAVADVGDQDGDGISEVGVGAPRWSPTPGGFPIGRVQIVSGSSLLSGSPVVLQDISGPTTMAGCAGTTGSNFGATISGGRDINGDGTPDFVAGGSFSGAVIPYDGATGAPMLPPGFDLNGPCARRHGTQVLLLDADGDAYADVLVTQAAPSTVFPSRYIVYRGAWIQNPTGGATKQIYGRSSSILLDHLGSKAVLLGDIDGDQRDDYALVSPNANGGPFSGGSVAVVSGATGTLLHRFAQIAGNGEFGEDIERVADRNGDGIDELAVSQSNWPSHTDAQGRVEIVNGSWMASGGVGVRSLEFVTLPGATSQSRFGSGLASADINGDGTSDLIAAHRGSSVREWAAFSGRTGSVMWNRGTPQSASAPYPGVATSMNLGSTAVTLIGMPATPIGPFITGGQMTVMRSHDAAGTRETFGVNCPCGNDDPEAGCANQTGQGGNLAVESGSASLFTGSLEFVATGLPSSSFGLFFGGVPSAPAVNGNGLLGVGQVIRLGVFQASPFGTTTVSGDLFADFATSSASTPGTVAPMVGVPFAMQLWYRDVGCNGALNFTNSYVMVPRP